MTNLEILKSLRTQALDRLALNMVPALHSTLQSEVDVLNGLIEAEEAREAERARRVLMKELTTLKNHLAVRQNELALAEARVQHLDQCIGWAVDKLKSHKLHSSAAALRSYARFG
jgi:hypothetical protein